MRNHDSFATVFFCVGFFFLSSLPLLVSAPQTSQADYTDYLPKYRTLEEKFLLSKIDYTEEKMIVFFRYVSNENEDVVTFHGKETASAWRLTTSIRSQASAAYSITRKASIQNIRVNDEAQAKYLDASDKKTIKVNRGDIVTCEMHFSILPRTIRTVHLQGGALDKQGGGRFNCNDILIKSKESNLLGTKEQMEGAIKRFYTKQPLVNYPDIKTATTVDEEENFKAKETISNRVAPVNPLAQALEPIDYMPKSLSSMNDMECNERIILTNVYFHDNKSEFAGRVKAMKTINIIVEYLEAFPKAKIVLHGHTDIFGNAFRNLELSRKRVALVKRTIAAKGINPNRIIAIHHGGAQPLTQYKNGGEMNRRVEAQVLCAGAKLNVNATTSLNNK